MVFEFGKNNFKKTERFTNEVIEKVNEIYGDNAEYILANEMFNHYFKQEIYAVEYLEEHPNTKITYEKCLESILKDAENINATYLTPANVKVGDGVTINLWSDGEAGTIIKKTKSTITVQRDKATLDPNFKPEWIPNGITPYCTNQKEQTYTYEADPNGHIRTLRWSKKYQMYGQPGNITASKGRHEFYDYNF